MFCITHQSPFQVNTNIMGKLIKINSKLINIFKTLGSNVLASCKGVKLNSFILIKAQFSDKFFCQKAKGKKSCLNNKRDFTVCRKLQDVLLFQSNIIFPLKNKFFEESKSSYLNEVNSICFGLFSFLYRVSFELGHRDTKQNLHQLE